MYRKINNPKRALRKWDNIHVRTETEGLTFRGKDHVFHYNSWSRRILGAYAGKLVSG